MNLRPALRLDAIGPSACLRFIRDYTRGLDGLFRKVENYPGDNHTEILVRDRRGFVRVERLRVGPGQRITLSQWPRAAAAMLAVLLISAMVLSAGMLNEPKGKVTLAWDYPTNELSRDLTFLIRRSTNISIPMTNWTVIARVVGTNMQATVFVTPGVNFFVCTASNLWGESDFSNVVSMPGLPRSDVNLVILRAE
jgi:hypothetical protein